MRCAFVSEKKLDEFFETNMCSWATSLTVLIIDFLRQFFTTNPLACDPSSLPKYPPSKEIDAKFREEEARRYVLKVVLPSLILNW